MSLIVHCPKCHRKLGVAANHVGQLVLCPYCGTGLRPALPTQTKKPPATGKDFPKATIPNQADQVGQQHPARSFGYLIIPVVVLVVCLPLLAWQWNTPESEAPPDDKPAAELAAPQQQAGQPPAENPPQAPAQQSQTPGPVTADQPAPQQTPETPQPTAKAAPKQVPEPDRNIDLEAAAKEEKLQAERKREREKRLQALQQAREAEMSALDEEIAQLKRSRDELKAQIAKVERQRGIKRSKVNGVVMIDQGPLTVQDRQLGQLQDKLENQRQQLQDRLLAAEGKRLVRAVQLEQERRQILRQFPEPQDPELVEYRGKLVTPNELGQIQTLQREHGSPRLAADHYLLSLLNRGIVEAADYLSEMPFQLTNGPPQKDTMMVFYRVRYVSQGGQVLVRNGYVIVVDRGDGFWFISALTQTQVIHFN